MQWLLALCISMDQHGLKFWIDYRCGRPRVFLSAESQTNSFKKFSMKNMYPLVSIQKPMENHYFHKSTINGPFSTDMLVYQRVGFNRRPQEISGSFRIARLLTAEELHGYDLVLGPKSSAEERFFPLERAMICLIHVYHLVMTNIAMENHHAINR